MRSKTSYFNDVNFSPDNLEDGYHLYYDAKDIRFLAHVEDKKVVGWRAVDKNGSFLRIKTLKKSAEEGTRWYKCTEADGKSMCVEISPEE